MGSSFKKVPDLEPTVGCFGTSPLWHLFLTLSSQAALPFVLLLVTATLFNLLVPDDFGEDLLLGLSEPCEFGTPSFFSRFRLEWLIMDCVIGRVFVGLHDTLFNNLLGTSGVFAASSRFLLKLGEPW